MTRNVDAGVLAELTKFSIRTATLVHLDWHTKDDSGIWKPTPLYLTDVGQNIVWNGTTYQSLGGLGAISGIEEGFELQEYSLMLTLSGIPSEFLSQVFNDITFANAYTNRPIKIYTAFLDDNYAVVDNPVLIFAGQMDSALVEVGETVTVSLTVHSRLINWEITRGGRFNEEDQKVRFPDDTGFQFVKRIQNAEIYFPNGLFAFSKQRLES